MHRRHSATALSALIAALVAAAPAAARERPDGADERPIPIDIAVSESPGEDVWGLQVVLPRPAAGVVFERQRNAFRAERWAVALAEGEATWHREGGAERICFGEPTSAFAASFRSMFDVLPKDYELNVPFSDGSRLLYTGHLLMRPLETCTPSEAEPVAGEPEPRFTFRTAPERTVRVRDAAAAGELAWSPPPLENGADTYVVFGNLEPIDTAEATILVDPGFPAWMAAEMREVLPPVVARFARQLDLELAFRPLILVAWGGAEGRGYSFSGGTLPGVLLAAANGPDWVERNAEMERLWFDRVAHELFHLWGGETVYPAEDAEWLSEAAADTFALRAGVDLGVISEADRARWLVDKANACLVRLGGRSVITAPAGGDYEAWYACGPVALATAAASLERAGTADGLGALFRELYGQAARTDGTYTTGSFLGWLEHLGGDRDTVAGLHRFLRAGIAEGADVFLQRRLEEAGVATERVVPEAARVDDRTVRVIVRRIVGRCLCGDAAGDTCDPAERGAAVAAVGGVSLRDPAAAWERVRSAIARQQPLAVTADDLEETLFCEASAFDPSWSGLLRLAPQGGADQPAAAE